MSIWPLVNKKLDVQDKGMMINRNYRGIHDMHVTVDVHFYFPVDGLNEYAVHCALEKVKGGKLDALDIKYSIPSSGGDIFERRQLFLTQEGFDRLLGMINDDNPEAHLELDPGMRAWIEGRKRHREWVDAVDKALDVACVSRVQQVTDVYRIGDV